MRFPLRFTSDFQLGVIARGMRARKRAPLVLKLAPFVEGVALELPAVESTPRLVWIGGAEPLEHLGIARFANALASSGREVFLHTNGALLRRRMHEFQPTGRFRFVLRFDGPSSAADSRVALDAVRGAKLSGFLVCGLRVMRGGDEIDTLARLHSELHRLDLDGYLIVPAAGTANSAEALSQARDRLLNRRWRRLSEMFEGAIADPVDAAAVSVRRAGPLIEEPAIPRRNPEHVSHDCGEGAQA
jgi:hypothetical protein